MQKEQHLLFGDLAVACPVTVGRGEGRVHASEPLLNLALVLVEVVVRAVVAVWVAKRRRVQRVEAASRHGAVGVGRGLYRSLCGLPSCCQEKKNDQV